MSATTSLPDGGAKLYSRLASLHQELVSLGGTGRILFAHTDFVPLATPLHLHAAQLLVCTGLPYPQHILQQLGHMYGLSNSFQNTSCTLHYTLPGGVFAANAECLAQLCNSECHVQARLIGCCVKMQSLT